MSEDKANMTIQGTLELEVGKKSNLPFGQGCPSLQERRLEWTITNVKDSPHLKHDDIRCTIEVTNTSRTEFSL